MTTITYHGTHYTLNAQETALECLLRHGVTFPHACKAGICQACLCRTSLADVKEAWQVGLKPTLAAQGYFLPCIAHIDRDIEIFPPNEGDTTVEAEILELFYFNHNVLCLKLRVQDFTPWIPGKYLNLVATEELVRSYSIANQPQIDGYIELHIKLAPSGSMSTWLTTEATPGQHIKIRGPIGDCFYANPTSEAFPIVLAGTGTGLAPLIGIAREALSQQHQGPIYLLHGGVNAKDLYLDETLTTLSEQQDAFHYKKCTLEESPQCETLSLDALLLSVLSNLTKPRLYLCGPADMTKKLKTKAFLSGVASSDIYSDAFITSSPQPSPTA